MSGDIDKMSEKDAVHHMHKRLKSLKKKIASDMKKAAASNASDLGSIASDRLAKKKEVTKTIKDIDSRTLEEAQKIAEMAIIYRNSPNVALKTLSEILHKSYSPLRSDSPSKSPHRINLNPKNIYEKEYSKLYKQN